MNMTLMEQIIARAKSCKQRIVLPESLEERTLTAADKALADDLADIILIGAQSEIFALADKLGLKNIGKATIIDPATSERTETYVQLLYNLRKNKGMTEEQAREKVKDPLYYGCLIIKNGDADGQISGALSTTGDTLRPALQIIKCAPGVLPGDPIISVLNYSAALAFSHRAVKAAGSWMAISLRTLRVRSIPDFFRPFMKVE